jgi:hypothetical protein
LEKDRYGVGSDRDRENGSFWFSSYSENWCQQQKYTSINFISNTRIVFTDYQRN